MHRVESLVIVGPPRAGKDTLVSGVAHEKFEPQAVTPVRYATRPYHSVDQKLAQWVHASREDFERGVAEGRIAPSWTRSLDIGEKPERYGFRKVDPADGRLRVYSANYPILQRPNPETQAVLAKAAVVLVTASKETLHARLDEIEPFIPDPRERNARRRKIDQDIPPIYYAGVIISTEGMAPDDGREVFRNLVTDVLKGWVPPGYPVDVPRPEPGSDQHGLNPPDTGGA